MGVNPVFLVRNYSREHISAKDWRSRASQIIILRLLQLPIGVNSELHLTVTNASPIRVYKPKVEFKLELTDAVPHNSDTVVVGSEGEVVGDLQGHLTPSLPL